MVRIPSMRRTWLGVGALALLVAAPVAMACVKSRDLVQQIRWTSAEVVVGTITDIQEVYSQDETGSDVCWTVVDFAVRESLKTGQKDSALRFYFLGGVFPGSPTTSITPSSQQMQEGNSLLLFLSRRDNRMRSFGQSVYQLDSYAESYSVVNHERQGIRSSVILGKGNGFAFPSNLSLDDAGTQVRQAFAKVQAENRQQAR